MSSGAEKLMVIHDASRNDGLNAIISAFESLPVKPGDELTLLGIIHPQLTKIKTIVDSTGSIKDDEQLRREEYYKREEVVQLSEICATKKIMFKVDVQSGSSPMKVAVKTAESLMVKCVVLERQMKKDKKYFMDKLNCEILRIKRDNTIEKLRGPIETEKKKPKTPKRTTSSEHVSYGEMIPVMSKRELSSNKTSNAHKVSSSHSSASTASSSSVSFQQDEIIPKNVQTPNYIPETKDQINQEPFTEQKEEFEYSVCSVCQNKRPSIQLKKDFKYADLQQVTNDFCSDNFLSEGGFGNVYEGKLKCGLKVAVKQHKDASLQGEKEFKAEVNVLSKARHPNLVVLLGSCSEGTHRLLVYEFVCFGSLDQHLSSHELTWDKRIKIALGSARGLNYLHSINIIHRDMRPNNILVTHDYEPLLGDFGLARVDSIDTDETGVVGTLGYVAPEYAECGKVSTKTDVYSFGVVLLQLITGYKTKEVKFEGKTLVEWARPLLEDKNYPNLIDDKILDSHDVQVFQLYLMVNLAERCLMKDPNNRDTMENVVHQLERIMEGTTSNIYLRKC